MTTQTATFAANLLGLSDSLTPAFRAIGIHRQGNGNFAVSIFSEFKDGKRGQSQIGFNHRTLGDAEVFANMQAEMLGISSVRVLPSALAA